MLAIGDSALRKETDAMTFVGCDLHTRMQQVAVLDTRTGVVSERQLAHDMGPLAVQREEIRGVGKPGRVHAGAHLTGWAGV